MESAVRNVIDMLDRRMAIRFGEFRLKKHENNPEAPLSPYFFNIRSPDNPKKGNLRPCDFDMIAHCLWQITLSNFLSFNAIAAIPRAGGPIVAAINRIVPMPRGFITIPLSKHEDENGRRIIPCDSWENPFPAGRKPKVVLFDDLVTAGDTKLEAILSLEASGCEVVGLVVLIDREQGGLQYIKNNGYQVVTAAKVSDIFLRLFINHRISEKKYIDSLRYLKQEQEEAGFLV